MISLKVYRYILLLFIFLCNFNFYGQSSWSADYPVNTTSNLEIKVSYKIIDCGKKVEFRFKYKGVANTNTEYLIFNFDYTTCNGNSNTAAVSLNISKEYLMIDQKDDWSDISVFDDKDQMPSDVREITPIFYNSKISST